jgi:hypothetical protein
MYSRTLLRLIPAIVFLAALCPSRAAVNVALAPKPGMPGEPVFLLTEAFSHLPDASEAAQHLDEAEWALRWGMYEEAQAAVDSAWALGLQNPQSASTRALAYARAATAPHRQWLHHMGSSLFDSYATVEPGPQPAMLQSLRISLAFTESTLAQFRPWSTNQPWNEAVNEVLEAAGETIITIGLPNRETTTNSLNCVSMHDPL